MKNSLLISYIALIGFLLIPSKALATIRYVKVIATGTGSGLSWVNASGDLQAMINASVDNDQIWVQQGTYYPNAYPTGCTNCTTTRDYAFSLKNNVLVFGGFLGVETTLETRNPKLNTTILSGNFGNTSNLNDNAYHVIVNVDEANPLLSGFTIMSGNANDLINGTATSINILKNAVNTTVYRDYGGGISNTKSNLDLLNCEVKDNIAFADGGGMDNSESIPRIYHTVFANNFSSGNGGAINNYLSGISLDNCVFFTNTANGNGGGINNLSYITSTSKITNCTFFNNIANTNAVDINFASNNSFNIENSIFWGVSANYISKSSLVKPNGSGTVLLENSIIFGGFANTLNCPNTNGNIDPLFKNATLAIGPDNKWGTTDDGLVPNICSPAIDKGKGFEFYVSLDIKGEPRAIDVIVIANLSSVFDIGAYEIQDKPDRLYVNANLTTGLNNGSSWINAFRGASALDLALNTSSCRTAEIWVAEGTYKPSSYPNGCVGCLTNRDFTFNISGNYKIYGGFAGFETNLEERVLGQHETILSGDNGTLSDDTDNIFHVVMGVNNSSYSEFDGFTIQKGGSPTNSGDPTIYFESVYINRIIGGGMVLKNSNDNIKAIKFINNNSQSGAGLCVQGSTSSTNISHCIFDGNLSTTSGGGLLSENGQLTLTKNRFTNNSSFFGSAIMNFDGSHQINNCIFDENNNIVVLNAGPQTTQYSNCIFYQNTSAAAVPTIRNGGGATTSFINCTIAENVNPINFGIENIDANSSIINTIIHLSTAIGSKVGLINSGTGSSQVFNSIITGGFSPCTSCPNTNGNIDPKFAIVSDEDGNDNIFPSFDDGLTLQSGSPAINTGLTSAVVPSTDILSFPVIGSQKDIGAYEYITKEYCILHRFVADNPIDGGIHRSSCDIVSIGKVAPSSNVTFDASYQITLLPGFQADASSVFVAKISDYCLFSKSF